LKNHHNKTILANGLTIATETMSELASVSINIGVGVGSRQESIQYNGITHFLEHMAFKGTATRSAKQIAEAFDQIGGSFDAYTSRENTIYTVKVLTEHLELAVEILADVLQNSNFDGQELIKERNVILQEIAQTNDAPDELVFDHFQEAAFPGQALGRPILGNAEIISGFTSDMLKAYVNNHYYSSKMIISAAGNIQHEQFTELVAGKFNNLNSGSLLYTEEGRYQGGTSYVKQDFEQVHLVVGFEGLSYHDPAIYTAQILTHILGGGMSSRLFQEVREKRGLAYSIGAFNSFFTDVGTTAIYAATSEAEANLLMEVVIDELQQITETITHAELDRAKTQFRARLVMSQESSYYRAEEMTHNYTIFQRQIPTEEILDTIMAIEIPDLHVLGKKIFTTTPTIAALGPISTLKDYEHLVDKMKF
jgi:predicted Zn-dependent peptidase